MFDTTKLDALMPAPMSPLRKLTVATMLVSVAIAWVVLATGGYLAPQAPNRGDFGFKSLSYVDHDAGLIGIKVWLPNSSSRDLRLTNVSLDAPGAEVVRVDVAPGRPTQPGAIVTSADGHTTTAVEGAVPEDFFAIPETVPLPVALPTDWPVLARPQEVLIWFRPTECTDTGDPWGFIEVTVDFGEGAFPRISRTFRDAEPVWAGGLGRTIDMWSGEDFVQAHGPLALACEVLR